MADKNIVSTDKAKEVLEAGMKKADALLTDNDEINKLVAEVQEKVNTVPFLGDAIKDFPVMVSMVKGYVTKEYTDVSPKVVATIVSAFLYLVSRKDIIPDNVPVLGVLDDIAVVALALKFVEPELRAYQEWQGTKKLEAPAEEPTETPTEEE